MTVLSAMYGIILYCYIREPGHGKYLADILNSRYKHQLKEKYKDNGKCDYE